MELTNRCFGRSLSFANRAEQICFGLGQACRDDYLEIVFLATSGYSSAAMKLLRGLYERSVALAYLVKHPDKAERFVRFAGIQEYRAMNSALNHFSEEEFNDAAGADNSVGKIRERYASVKEEFQQKACDDCGRKAVAVSWDIDVASMAKKVGEPFFGLYIGAYSVPNLHVHATLASAVGDDGKLEAEFAQDRRDEADFVVATASVLHTQVIRLQNQLFVLGLDDKIRDCARKADS